MKTKSPELLPYKYKALKFADAYNEKSTVQLGWKARKYIKWKDVHVGDDRETLKRFGDLAVDNGKIDRKLFSRVNEILLNVQFWRQDKENWSIEPTHEKYWDKAYELIITANQTPRVVISYLSEYETPIRDLPNEELYQLFINTVLVELILSVRASDGSKISPDMVDGDIGDVLDRLLKINPEWAELEHVDLGNPEEAFGLPAVEKDSSLKGDIGELVVKKPTTIVYEKRDKSKLFRVSEGKEGITIYLNENNMAVMASQQSELVSNFFANFIKAYAKSLDSNPGLSDALDDFNAYLAIQLNRQFKQ